MHIAVKSLKPLSSVTLTADDHAIIKWLRSANWEPQKDARDPIPYKAKVPEFFSGVRLYRLQGSTGGNSLGALELFLKKLEHQGVITRQELYPLSGHGSATARYLSLKKTDLENLGVGREEEEEE